MHSFIHYLTLSSPFPFSLICIQNADIEQFQRDKKRTIRALHRVGGDLQSLDHRKYCVRGFESYQSWRLHDALRRQRKKVLERTLRTQQPCGPAPHRFTAKWALQLASIDAQERYQSVYCNNENSRRQKSGEEDEQYVLQEIINCRRKLRIQQQKQKRKREEEEEDAVSLSTTASESSSVVTPLVHEGTPSKRCKTRGSSTTTTNNNSMDPSVAVANVIVIE